MTRAFRCCLTVILWTCGSLIFSLGQLASAQSLDNLQSQPVRMNLASIAQVDEGSTTNKTTNTTGGTNTPAAQLDQLKAEQTLLKEMDEAIRRTRRPVVDMINECMRPLAPAVGGIGGDLDIREGDIIPDPPPITEFAGKYAPPRKKYMKLHMNQLASMIPFLQDEIDSLKIPDSEKDFAAQPLEDIDGYMGDIELHFKKLKTIAKSGNYNQVSTINECRGLDASCKAVDEARRKLMHVDETTEHKDQKLEKKAK